MARVFASSSSSASRHDASDSDGDDDDDTGWQSRVYASLQLPLDVLVPAMYTSPPPPCHVDTAYDVTIDYGDATTRDNNNSNNGNGNNRRRAGVACGHVRVLYAPYYHVHRNDVARGAAAAATTRMAATAAASGGSHATAASAPMTLPAGDFATTTTTATTAANASSAGERRRSNSSSGGGAARDGDGGHAMAATATTTMATDAAAAPVTTTRELHRDDSARSDSVDAHEDSDGGVSSQPAVVRDIKKGLMAALTASPRGNASLYNSDSASDALSSDAHGRDVTAMAARHHRRGGNGNNGDDNASSDTTDMLGDAARARLRGGGVCDASRVTAAALLVRLVQLVATGGGGGDARGDAASTTRPSPRTLADCVTTIDMSYTRLGVVGATGPPMHFDANGDALPTTTTTTTAASANAATCNSSSSSRRHHNNNSSGSSYAAAVDAMRFYPDEAVPRSRTSAKVRARVAQRSLALCYIAPLLFVPGLPYYRVTTLVCAHCALGDHDAHALAHILRGKPSKTHECALATIDASYNDFTDVGAEYLKKALKFCRTLTTLQLSGNVRITNRHGVLDVIRRRLQHNIEGKSNTRWYHHRH